jgi:hypothetical protein
MKILNKIEDDLSDAWNDEIDDIKSLASDEDMPFLEFIYGFVVHWCHRIFCFRP